MIAYGIFRFFIEYLRNDDRGGFIPGISPSQFWSILMVVLGVGLIFLVEYLWKKRKQTEVVEVVESSLEETQDADNVSEENVSDETQALKTADEKIETAEEIQDTDEAEK